MKNYVHVWEELEDYFKDDRLDYYSGPIKVEQIIEAERVLRVRFPQSYKRFVEGYGGAMIKGYLIHGLGYQGDMDAQRWSIIDRTKFYKEKQKWPDIDDWYIISDDGRGNPIGINKKGEVWLSDHDSNFEQVKLADNFEEFIHKLLTDTLYD